MSGAVDHPRIYLEPACCADPREGRMWSEDGGVCDCDTPWTEYLPATTITALQAEVAALREALEPLARLEPPSKPQGNAGFYSIYHKHIIAARAALGQQP